MTPNLKDKPLISIITVVFNGEKYLEKTILSIINQSYTNIEYIIIDGSSTDGTLAIIKKYSHAINYFISESDQGIYDAMNKGIKAASGDWVNFMNAGDCFFENNTLHILSKFLSNDIDLIYGNHAIYQEEKNKHDIIDVKNKNPRWNIPFCHQSLFTRKTILEKHPFDTKYQISGDYNQYLEIKHSKTKIKHVPLTISLYLNGGISATAKKAWIIEHRKIHRHYFKISADALYILRLIKLAIFGK
jgi:glycosyltransferase involved in cell wall biosynthesis